MIIWKINLHIYLRQKKKSIRRTCCNNTVNRSHPTLPTLELNDLSGSLSYQWTCEWTPSPSLANCIKTICGISNACKEVGFFVSFLIFICNNHTHSILFSSTERISPGDRKNCLHSHYKHNKVSLFCFWAVPCCMVTIDLKQFLSLPPWFNTGWGCDLLWGVFS